jgi:hypothetical protein
MRALQYRVVPIQGETFEFQNWMESVSQSSLKKHRRLRTAESDFDFDDPSSTSLNHSEPSNCKELRVGRFTPEKIVWILSGLVVVYFSKLHLHILPSNWPKSAYSLPLWLAYVCFAAFVALFVYLNYYLRYMQGIKITALHWKRDAPIAVPAVTITGSLIFACLFVGFWPHYRLWTLFMFPVLFMSFFAFISLL